jgi:hypothetical protein
MSVFREVNGSWTDPPKKYLQMNMSQRDYSDYVEIKVETTRQVEDVIPGTVYILNK